MNNNKSLEALTFTKNQPTRINDTTFDFDFDFSLCHGWYSCCRY